MEKPVRRSLEWSRRRTSDSPWDQEVPLDYMAEKTKELSGEDGMEISPLRLQWVAGEPLGAAPRWKDIRVEVERFVAEEKYPERKTQENEDKITEDDLQRSKEEWQDALLRCYNRQEGKMHSFRRVRTACEQDASHWLST